MPPATSEFEIRNAEYGYAGRGPQDSGLRSQVSGLSISLLAVLLAAPLALGSVHALAWSALALAMAALLALWAFSVRLPAAGSRLSQSASLQPTAYSLQPVFWTPLYIPLALFLGLSLVQYYAGGSVDPVGTREAIVKLATALIVFFLATQLAATRPAVVRQWAAVICLYASLLALFAIVQFFTAGKAIYWVYRSRWGGWPFGPYVYHADYAGLMEMLVPIALMYVLVLPRGDARRAPLGFGVLLAIASLLLCGSRGGFVAMLVEIVVFVVLLGATGRADRHSPSRPLLDAFSLRLLAVSCFVAGAILFVWLDPGGLWQRLLRTFSASTINEQLEAGRLSAWRDSLRMFAARPFAGWGLGSFELAFPRFRGFPTEYLWDHLHNDYLQALAETGLAGALLILSSLVLFFRELVHSALGNSAFRSALSTSHSAPSTQHSALSTEHSALRLGAAIACIGLLVHSAMDFNLRIPANAVWFAFCAGIAVAGQWPVASRQPQALV